MKAPITELFMASKMEEPTMSTMEPIKDGANA
jgi:hypothetical protein